MRVRAPRGGGVVAVVGASGVGKSSLVGVLTGGCLDNGNGLARLHVLRHRHELEDGRTSSVSRQVVGAPDRQGRSVPGRALAAGRALLHARYHRLRTARWLALFQMH